MTKREELFQEWLYQAIDDLAITGDADVAEDEFDTLLWAFTTDLSVVIGIPSKEIGH